MRSVVDWRLYPPAAAFEEATDAKDEAEVVPAAAVADVVHRDAVVVKRDDESDGSDDSVDETRQEACHIAHKR